MRVVTIRSTRLIQSILLGGGVDRFGVIVVTAITLAGVIQLILFTDVDTIVVITDVDATL